MSRARVLRLERAVRPHSVHPVLAQWAGSLSDDDLVAELEALREGLGRRQRNATSARVRALSDDELLDELTKAQAALAADEKRQTEEEL